MLDPELRRQVVDLLDRGFSVRNIASMMVQSELHKINLLEYANRIENREYDVKLIERTITTGKQTD